jgi:large subunit ribosomal protein L13
MEELNIDATNTIAGRLATRAAKEALMGKKVNVFNAEKAIMSGDAKKVAEKYRYKRSEMGQPRKGPFIPRMPDRFLRRVIRGMLPYKRERGSDAFKRIMCYAGVPEQFKDKKLTVFEKDTVKKLPKLKYITVQDICKYMGAQFK